MNIVLAKLLLFTVYVYTNLEKKEKGEKEDEERIRFLTQMTLEDFKISKKDLFFKKEKNLSSCKLFFLTGSISLLLYYFL